MLREMKTFAPRLSIAAGLAALMMSAGSASAVVVYSDDFEDADLNGGGWEISDTDVNFDGITDTWVSGWGHP